MRLCEFCGAQLTNDSPCDCQEALQAAWQRAQQSPQPSYVQQPGQPPPYMQPGQQQPFIPQPDPQQPYAWQPDPQQSYMRQPFMQQPYPQYEQKSKPPKGKTMIFVTGIIMIVFGSIALLATVSVLIGLNGFFSSILTSLMIYELLVGALTLIFGIAGVVNTGKEIKANSIITMGFILLMMRIIDTVATGIILSDIGASILSAILGSMLGYVLPILYIVGGNMNKSSIQQQTPPL